MGVFWFLLVFVTTLWIATRDCITKFWFCCFKNTYVKCPHRTLRNQHNPFSCSLGIRTNYVAIKCLTIITIWIHTKQTHTPNEKPPFGLDDEYVPKAMNAYQVCLPHTQYVIIEISSSFKSMKARWTFSL